MVDALASQVAARHQNQQLFDETLEQRGHLADVVGSSSDGIFVLSTARSVLSWNPAMERISGFLADEAVGRPIAEVLVVSGAHEDEGRRSGRSRLGGHGSGGRLDPPPRRLGAMDPLHAQQHARPGGHRRRASWSPPAT